MVASKTITILSAITCILTLVSVGLTASHSMSHSSVKYKSSGLVVKTMGNLADCPSAVKVKVETDDIEMVISCPYKPATKAIALISLIALQLLLILLCCKLRNKVKPIIILIFAIIEFPLLFVGGILMVVDMINGKKELSDMSNYSYQPFEYVINVLFVFLGLICGGATTYFSYTNKPPIHPTKLGVTSMTATEPQWSEGESRSQTADYGKSYPQTNNISTYQDYQGNQSSANLLTNNPNTSASSPNGRGGQAYQPQNDRYGRNNSYEENPQNRPRQQSNASNFNYNNGYDRNGSSYGNTPQRPMGQIIEAHNPNQNNYNNNANQNNFNNGNQNNNYNQNGAQNDNMNNSRAGPQNRGNRNNYPGSNQSQISTNNQNGTVSYERGPERSLDDNSYGNNGNGQNKLNSALNRIGAFENGSNNRGYLVSGNGSNQQGSMNNYESNTLDYYRREGLNNQNNYEEGNYQRANQRNTHVSQINGNNISYNNNNNGMGRTAPNQNYGGY